MTVRTKSWVGAVGTALGVVLMLIALLSARIVNGIPSYSKTLLGAGAALSAAGLAVILWALAGVLRQIGASDAKLEERLRAETDALRGTKRPS